MITVPDMEWSADGENTDYSTSSSPIVRRPQQNPDPDSLSDEDDFSDEFSVIDSDDEKQRAFTQHSVLQVCAFSSRTFLKFYKFVEPTMIIVYRNSVQTIEMLVCQIEQNNPYLPNQFLQQSNYKIVNFFL